MPLCAVNHEAGAESTVPGRTSALRAMHSTFPGPEAAGAAHMVPVFGLERAFKDSLSSGLPFPCVSVFLDKIPLSRALLEALELEPVSVKPTELCAAELTISVKSLLCF